MSNLSERIARAALRQFDELPAKCKPRTHPDGRREWIPLSAVVAVRDDQVECLSLATGTKCLSATALPKCNGTVLHDSHAEVLALRGFNRWALREIEMMLLLHRSNYIQQATAYSYQDWNKTGNHLPFAFRDNVTFHLFTTEAPCGDASMDLLIKSMPPGGEVPWPMDPKGLTDATGPKLLGRGYFSQLGAVRRKPSRGDAEATMSKSCSDKLAVKQFTGLLSFPADIFIERTPNSFLQSLVVYSDQYDHTGYERAFGPKFRLFALDREAQFFKTSILAASFPRFSFEKNSGRNSSKASNISALWILGSDDCTHDTPEVILKGVKQGFKQFEERPGKESAVCRKRMWSRGLEIEKLVLSASDYSSSYTWPDASWLPIGTYTDSKAHPARAAKTELKRAVTEKLRGWALNTGDEGWSLG